jgi:predicted nucleotidyltransferase
MAERPDLSTIAAAVARVAADPDLPPVVSAYVFGSVAAGHAHRESDVDIGVLFDYARSGSRRARFEARLRLAARLAGALRFDRVDVVVLNDVPPTFARSVVSQGQRIFCTDAEADHAFVRDAQLRAADLEPFLRRTRRVKLAAIAR